MKQLKKLTLSTLAIAMTITMVPSKMTTVNAADIPAYYDLPITLYDHIGDGLLFEYPTGTTATKLDLFSDTSYFGSDALRGMGLVADELGPNGKPVYKEATVEYVARVLQDYFSNVSRSSLKPIAQDLYDQIISAPIVVNTRVEPEDYADLSSTVFFEETGWDFGTLTRDGDTWKKDGATVWERGGDHFVFKGSEDSTITYVNDNIDPGDYNFYLWHRDLDIDIEVNGVPIASTIYGDNARATATPFTVDASRRLEIIVRASSSTVSNHFVSAFQIKDSSNAVVIDNLQNYDASNVTSILSKRILNSELFTHSTGNTFYAPAGSTWHYVTAWGGGGISSTLVDAANQPSNPTGGDLLYIVDNPIPGVQYRVTFDNEANNTSHNNLLGISATDQADNPLTMTTIENSNGKTSVDIDVPSTATKLILHFFEDNTSETGYRKLQNLKITPKPTLGTYAASKTKFDHSGTFADIDSCFDYAYYFLNSMWSDTNGDITKKSDTFKSLRINRVGDTTKYFADQTKLNYDNATGKIYYDAGITEATDGFFPLDATHLGSHNDVSAFQTAHGDAEMTFGTTDRYHNYHYGMTIHTQFAYQSDMYLTFKGDDDVYIYFDGKLAMDIGGAHTSIGKTVNLNDYSSIYQEGDIVTMDFFYLERHRDLSNFNFETNIPFIDPKIDANSAFYDKSSLSPTTPIADGTIVEAGTDINIQYEIVAKNKRMRNLTINDVGTDGFGVDIVMDRDDPSLRHITLSQGAHVNDKLTFTVIYANGNPSAIIEFDKNDLNNATKLAELSGLEFNIDDKIIVDGISKSVSTDTMFKSNFVGSLGVDVYNFVEGSYHQVKRQIPGSKELFIAPANEPVSSLVHTLNYPSTAVVTEDGIEKLKEGTVIDFHYEIVSNSQEMRNISLVDHITDDLGTHDFSFGSSGIVIPAGYSIASSGLKFTVKNADNTTRETITILPSDISGSTPAYTSLLSKLGTEWRLDDGEKLIVTGLQNTLSPTITTISSEAISTIHGIRPHYSGGVFTPEDVETHGVTDPAVQSIKPKQTTYTVTYGFRDTYPGTTYTDTSLQNQRIGKDEYSTVPTISSTDYDFVKWYVNGVAQAADFNPATHPITADTVFLAEMSTKYDYTVKYEDGDGHTLKTSTTGKKGEGLTLAPEVPDITGYVKPAGQSITITSDPTHNVITYVYTLGSFAYEVNYLDNADHSHVLHTKKTSSALFNKDVTEAPIAIDGYSYHHSDPTTGKITISATEANNVINIYYTVNSYPYTIRYYKAGTTTEVKPSVTGPDTPFGNTITGITPPDVPGYTTPTSKDLTITSGTNEVIFYYAPIPYSYTVRLVDDATGVLLVNPKKPDDTALSSSRTVNDILYGTSITEDAPAIKGYTLVSSGSLTKTISNVLTDNVFEFRYTANPYHYTVKLIDNIGNVIVSPVQPDDTLITNPDSTGTALFGTHLTKVAPTLKGYTLSSDSSVTKTISNVEADNLFVFTYTPVDCQYVVECYVEGTTTLIQSSTPVNAPFASSVTKGAPTITGYTHSSADPSSKTITMALTGNVIKFYYTVNSYPYTIHYYKAGTTTEVTPAVTGLNTPFGTTITGITPPDVDGYTTPTSQDLTITAGINDVIFYYSPIQYPYEVRYEDEFGNEIKTPDTGVEYFGSNFTGTAPDITGYTKPTVDSVSQTTVVDDASNLQHNIITFTYTTNLYDYTVQYVDGNGNPLASNKTVEDVLYHSSKTETAISIDGYHPINTTETKTIGTNTVFTFVYQPNQYDVTVKYVDEDGETLATDKVIASQPFNSSVIEPSLDIHGYLPNVTTQTKVVGVSNNTITFVYQKGSYPYTIHYVDQDGNALAPDKIVPTTLYGTSISENALEIEGYVPNASTLTMVIDTTNNSLTFIYNPLPLLGAQAPQSGGNGNGNVLSPDTGDHAYMSLCMAVGTISMFGVVIIRKKKD